MIYLNTNERIYLRGKIITINSGSPGWQRSMCLQPGGLKGRAAKLLLVRRPEDRSRLQVQKLIVTMRVSGFNYFTKNYFYIEWQKPQSSISLVLLYPSADSPYS
jgi:hypothetical protein